MWLKVLGFLDLVVVAKCTDATGNMHGQSGNGFGGFESDYLVL